MNFTSEVVTSRKMNTYNKELSFHSGVSAVSTMAKENSHMNCGSEEHVVLREALRDDHPGLRRKYSLNYLLKSECGKILFFPTVGHIKI